ncbi:hypothetical protein P0136_02495 [Lentisphaerota bacterium ZTH]|nr:hypothetical protein JYG24_06365 [Lentisphaerota bacterium]WET06871.1 hypothetical protein P0136_02495 [Lentisphaerota bacterium ZTH]
MVITYRKVHKKAVLIFTVSFAAFALMGAAAAESDIENAVLGAKEQHAILLAEVDILTEKARQARRKRNFADASAFYEKASKKLGSLSGKIAAFRQKKLAEEYKKFKYLWGRSVMAKARKAFIRGKYEQALNIVAEVTIIDPSQSKEVLAFMEECKKGKRQAEIRLKADINSFAKNIPEEDAKLELLYRQAQVLFKHKMFEKARGKAEQILLEDPYNKQAMRMLDDIYNELYKFAMERRKADVRDMLAYNTWVWNDPVLPTQAGRIISGSAKVKTSENIQLYDRLENIIFLKIDFESADIYSVIRYLSNRSAVNDPEKIGVSIIPGFPKKVADSLPKVTMSFTNIPLSEILRYLCQNVGLKSKVTADAVIIGTNVDEMQTRDFIVRADLISDVIGSDVGSGDGDKEAEKITSGGGDFFDTEGAFEDTAEKSEVSLDVTQAALKKYFEDRGIKFGEGATIAYEPRTGKLIVKNTLTNLRKMDSILRQLELIKKPMVMVETKIVEVTSTDIEELGFDWSFSVPYIANSQNADHPGWWINEFTNAAGEQENLQKNPVRHYESITDPNASGYGGSYKMVNNLKIFPNFGKALFGEGTRVDLTLSVNAIAQNQRSETLFAPKVITVSGSSATIRMVREEYYPESWEDPEVNVNNQTVEIQAPVPEFGDATDIGILLTVKPVVDPDMYTINLHLAPQIVSFVKFTDYPVNIQTGQVLGDGTIVNGVSQTFNISMPEIARRDLDVHITVYDGETIVLGGMVDNQNIFRDDKWPVIGDIPFIGRFFSSQLAYTEQKNLLIFVTTRLINNDGIPVRRNRRHGVPEFYR